MAPPGYVMWPINYLLRIKYGYFTCGLLSTNKQISRSNATLKDIFSASVKQTIQLIQRELCLFQKQPSGLGLPLRIYEYYKE